MDDDVWLRTPRLVLRGWRDADREPFAQLNADPEVMAHFPAVLTRAESDTRADRIEADLAEHGFGLWALEVAATGAFIGFAGLNPARFPAHFTPAVEVGWRLARHAWGYGYATEAARAAVAFGFDRCGTEEIVSFTSRTNVRSQAVMRRLGMRCDSADDFDHPQLPAGHRLTPHVLYRLSADDV
ncbi:GNAT family N-acetyltransferase [Streptomonospora salina]|uniref:Ribosomal-protein-alanine N-acetyltransferase n=1 Tax=Streptomonospora salina TaxID=104205 RepID=A0A841EA30_9ACTN|nr:GNAT family N-acetyltransferase [Streptomonospora salina]MBB5996311.1 ribosomal-protein-alanine N-acetyltransferase [Streptomonospora salina]